VRTEIYIFMFLLLLLIMQCAAAAHCIICKALYGIKYIIVLHSDFVHTILFYVMSLSAKMSLRVNSLDKRV
jgi:hypothetical protein